MMVDAWLTSSQNKGMIKVTPTSKLSKTLQLHPDMLDYIVSLSPHEFKRLHNPLMRKIMPQRITLARIAQMTHTPLAELLINIHKKAQLTLDAADYRKINQLVENANAEALPHNANFPPDWVFEPLTAVVDLLESDDRLDTDPFVPLFPVINRAKEGDVILLKHRWQPQPLYDVWKKLNIKHYATRVAENEWWVYILKGKKGQGKK